MTIHFKDLLEDVYAADRGEKQWVDPKTGKTKKRIIQAHRIQFAASKLHKGQEDKDARPDYLKVEEEVESIDEISKELANSYMHSAMYDRNQNDEKVSKALEKNRKQFSMRRHGNITKLMAKSEKRSAGIQSALNRLKEDMEHLKQELHEVLSKDAKAGDWIHDFVHSDNPKFEGKSKKERIRMALGAYYAKHQKEEVQLQEKSAQARRNKTWKNLMAASRGARANKDVGLTPDLTGHKNNQQMNKAIGRAVARGEMHEARDDAYTRDYKSSIAGMGKHQSHAYHADGGANDEGWGNERHSFKPKSTMDRPHTVSIGGKDWKKFPNGHQAHAAVKTLKAKGKDASARAHFNEDAEQFCPTCQQDPCVCGGNHITEGKQMTEMEKYLAALNESRDFRTTLAEKDLGTHGKSEEDREEEEEDEKLIKKMVKPEALKKEEVENLEEKNWIAGAIKKPGAETAAAKRAGMSTQEYMQKHKHDSGKAGKRARLGLTLSKLAKEETYKGLEKEDEPGEVKTEFKGAKNAVSGKTVEGWKDTGKVKKESEEMAKTYKDFINEMEFVNGKYVHKGTYGYGGKGASYGQTDYDKENLDAKDEKEYEGAKRGPKAGSKRGPKKILGTSKLHTK